MADLSGRRILVVEDEAAIALDLARLLRDCGAKVVGPVADGEEALRHVAQTRIDCAVLDVKLGAGDCGLIAEALSWKLVPFIFVTGYSQHSDVISRYSWSPVIAKPYTPTDVIDGIDSVLKG
jgi:CheY-like chemotaxis protein